MYENVQLPEPISLLYFYMSFWRIQINSEFFKWNSKVAMENQSFPAKFYKLAVYEKISVI